MYRIPLFYVLCYWAKMTAELQVTWFYLEMEALLETVESFSAFERKIPGRCLRCPKNNAFVAVIEDLEMDVLDPYFLFVCLFVCFLHKFIFQYNDIIVPRKLFYSGGLLSKNE
mmetsp:Transcript_25700/g.33664  ORF Transcript_25700/g.33664 Transcript_25700/m.33664 type:complete len:113 (-) Transcript_25700:129-467(-)